MYIYFVNGMYSGITQVGLLEIEWMSEGIHNDWLSISQCNLHWY